MLKDRLIAWSPVILLLLLAVLTWWLDARVRSPNTQLDGIGQHDPEFYIEGFMAVRMNPDGTRRYELTGTRLTHYSDGSGSKLDSTGAVRTERYQAVWAGSAALPAAVLRGLDPARRGVALAPALAVGGQRPDPRLSA